MNTQQLGGQPIFILPEGSIRNTGKNVQKNNIAAAVAVADTIKSTLGPKGMDKMLVDSLGDITITNDGVTILNEMEIEHPAGKMIVEVAKTQNQEVGDGTTTAVIITGELLKRSEELLNQNVHPTIITKGFKLAKEHSIKVLNSFASKVDIKQQEILKNVAITSMMGKSAEKVSDQLANLTVSAIIEVSEEIDGKVVIDTNNIGLEKKTGGSIEDTELIKGIIIDKEIAHSDMKKVIKNAKILLLDSAIEVKELEGDAKLNINSPDQMQSFIQKEEEMLKGMVDKIVATGANIVFCQKGIDDMAQYYLSKKGISAVRRVKKSDIEKLSKATNSKTMANINDMNEKDLGYAGVVEEQKIGGESMIFVRDCKNPKAVSILVRGGTKHVVDEIERAVDDAIKGIAAALELGRILPGGGAAEIELSKQLRKFSNSFKGREQLAIQAFADAVEIIPRTLAENAGIDQLNLLVELRSAHEDGKVTAGVDVFSKSIGDMAKLNVLEPLKMKLQSIKSAEEVSEMILRIDDVISSTKSNSAGMPPGGMGGMGGMPPGGMGEF